MQTANADIFTHDISLRNWSRAMDAVIQYNSLGEYCGPHTASSVFLILVSN